MILSHRPNTGISKIHDEKMGFPSTPNKSDKFLDIKSDYSMTNFN